MKDLDLLPKGYKMMVVGSVQEEDCNFVFHSDNVVLSSSSFMFSIAVISVSSTVLRCVEETDINMQ